MINERVSPLVARGVAHCPGTTPQDAPSLVILTRRARISVVASTRPCRQCPIQRGFAAIDGVIGKDLMRAQWRWPVGMPLCRPMGSGLWEIRTDRPSKRTARVLLCLYRGHLVALHGFVKKTRATPDEDLATARKRQKELER